MVLFFLGTTGTPPKWTLRVLDREILRVLRQKLLWAIVRVLRANYYGQSYGYFEQITMDFLGRFGAQIRKV